MTHHERRKGDMPNSNIAIMWTPIFEWYVVMCGSKNRHPKDTCLKEIGLCVQNELTILGLVVNIIWGLGGMTPFNKHVNFQFCTKKQESEICMSTLHFNGNDYLLHNQNAGGKDKNN